ncbi:MFS transporter [Burkholderia sp. L27(2015)]|uniref:MFS transporter n=1 Tax=Burkholderia sp. L27(2015) TaxID=1641858 RepID=UPI00131C075C|nr:MFS transporter [Burkholderia sp. L27(2015)]
MSGSKARATQHGTVLPSVAPIEAVPRADIDAYLNPGTAAYRHTSAAMLLAGFATFSLMYCVQPLLPELATVFSVSPAVSSLSLSLTTGLLAVSIFIAGLMSDSLNRKSLMTASLMASALLNIAAATMPNWHSLLLVRALEGIALGGLPAVAMAYISEEVHPKGLGLAMGLYVSGTAFGGMAGRIITGVLADYFSWRWAVGTIGVLGLLAALAFVLLLPPSRRFKPVRSQGLADPLRTLGLLLRQPGLPSLFALAFLLMGGFVAIYNYIGFRLLLPPYQLNQTEIGAIFVVYMVGMVASAWCGRLADRYGRGLILKAAVMLMAGGLALMLAQPLVLVIAGIVLLTFGFFAAHSVASGWVGQLAPRSKGLASSLYLLAYYLGSSLLGSLGGHFWSADSWLGVTIMVAVLLGVALALTSRIKVRAAA